MRCLRRVILVLSLFLGADLLVAGDIKFTDLTQECGVTFRCDPPPVTQMNGTYRWGGLAAWNTDDPVADLDGNFFIDGRDLLILLAHWTMGP